MAKVYTYSLIDSPDSEIGEILTNKDDEAIKIAKEAKAFRLFKREYKLGHCVNKKIIYEASVG